MNSPFLILVGILACVVRFHIADSGEENLLAIMAMINIVALDYVILILTQDARRLVIDSLKISQFSEDTLKKCVTKLNIYYGLFYLLVFGVFGFIYVNCLYSSEGNDAVSIMALVISISSDRLSKHLGHFIYALY